MKKHNTPQSKENLLQNAQTMVDICFDIIISKVARVTIWIYASPFALPILSETPKSVNGKADELSSMIPL